MKVIIILSIILYSTFASMAQVPNGNFEEWQIIDSIENPVGWQSNNYYVGYTPVAKTTDAIEGQYSMKVSSTARDEIGTTTGFGCAHVKLVPTLEYNFLTASVRSDSVVTDGDVSIRIKQWQPAEALYDNIGFWKSTIATNGIWQIVVPIDQLGLDTLLIEVWAKNKWSFFIEDRGYSEIIIDNLELSTVVSAHEATEELAICTIFPNPTNELLKVRLTNNPTIIPDELSIADLQGKVLTTIPQPFLLANEISIDVQGLLPGLYVLTLKSGGSVIGQKKVVVYK
jgi:Secretion system C-terminal sorting domain